MNSLGPKSSKLRRFWNKTPLRTYLFDGLSVLMPISEEFIMDVAEETRHRLPQRLELHRQVVDLIAEERAHQRAHRLYNQRLQSQGYEVEGFERALAADLAALSVKLSPNAKLAFIAAGEHLTSTLSTVALRRGGLLCTVEDSPQARLWRWHCEEEVAHRHVTLDLLHALQVPYWQRVAWYVPVSGLLLFDAVRHVISFARVDVARGRIGLAALLGDVGRFFWCDAGNLLRLAAGWLRYFLPLAPNER